MHEILQIIVAVIYCILGILCLGLGATRGNRIKRVNGEVVFFFIYFMALWYFLATWTNFKITNWERDDGIFDISILRFAASFTIMITFLSLTGYKIKQDALDVISYTFLCVFVNISLIISVLLYDGDARNNWIYVTFAFMGILIIHSIRDTFHEKIPHARFIRSIVFLVSGYGLIFIFTTLWSPLHQNLIDFKTQEIIMIIFDVIISILCAFPIVHYGWGISESLSPRISPGFISNIFQINRDRMLSDDTIRDSLHTF